MQPETRYASAPDGLIADQVIGDGPRDLVYLSGATSHVDVRWESRYYAQFQERLASFSRLILFDRRGVGASDPVAIQSLPTWEEWADDLRIVLDAAGSEQTAVFAVLDAEAMAILFAASHPDRTTALVLCHASARATAADDYPEGVPIETFNQLLDMTEKYWGTEDFAVMTSPSIAATSDRVPPSAAWERRKPSPPASPRRGGTVMEAADVEWAVYEVTTP